MAKMSRHITEDWCHICGERKDRLCDVWYPTNAELAKAQIIQESEVEHKYIRICQDCAITISKKSEER